MSKGPESQAFAGPRASGTTTPPVQKQDSVSTLDSSAKEEIKNKRASVIYQAKETPDRGSPMIRRSSAPFDKAHIGTKTRHGIMPGPRGLANAKINQDRGVVCWPFHGSLNEALLCVFDGHGSKGEKASEFCMTQLPVLLDKDHDALLTDPFECLSRNIIKLNELLFSSTLGQAAMSMGTTSNVLYMKGEELWCACSGDSRAILASRKDGRIVATNLSEDHKPDLPSERVRIEAAGGFVSESGPGGRPSRVWANGRVGLAMSRSIGDGECKKVGVIPDPEVKKFTLKPPKEQGADGDLFVILASDGVWEFIDSQEAAEIVALSHERPHASEACDLLVSEAADRWRREEGNYRDDITAIITFLPFLEDWGDHEGEVACNEGPGMHEVFIGKGSKGLSKLKHSPVVQRKAGNEGAIAENVENFAARRLSLSNPFNGGDDDWENAEEEEDDEDK